MENKSKSESKEERFKRVASRRTQKVLDGLHRLGNCSKTSIYKYNSQDVNKIFRAIDDELRAVKSSFNKLSGERDFSL